MDFRLARLVSEQGAVVVSGLADGIDRAAHEAAIHHGGKTIAVIGTPLDRVYSAKNRALQEAIAHSQLLLSQFPSGHPVTKANFPHRNRTMAPSLSWPREMPLADKAAEGLEVSSDIASRSIHSWEYAWREGRDRLTDRDIFVIDEAGMVGPR